MKHSSFFKTAASLALCTAGLSGQAMASGLLYSDNGTVRVGINDDGSIDADTVDGTIGVGYNFTGQGGRTGFQDALTPGCYCEAWGVSGNGLGGQVGRANGNQNITVGASSSTATSFTSNTSLSTLPGLSVSQVFSLSNENASGALFKNVVTLTNTTGSTITDLRYARAMDWDVPPTEFSEYVTFKGVGSTTSLLRATDNGFANANPLSAVLDGGIIGPIDADGTTGPADHGSLFVFGFGDLAAGEEYTFNIFYGAAGNEAGALSLLSAISPELYSLGQSNLEGRRRSDLPTYIFAFNGVGGSVVVPPPNEGVPEPSNWAMLIAGFGAVGGSMRYRKAKTAVRFA
jgi:type IV pilus assembly protein PilY1